MAMLVLLNNADHDKEEDRQHKRNVHGGSHEPHASTRRMQSASRNLPHGHIPREQKRVPHPLQSHADSVCRTVQTVRKDLSCFGMVEGMPQSMHHEPSSQSSQSSSSNGMVWWGRGGEGHGAFRSVIVFAVFEAFEIQG